MSEPRDLLAQGLNSHLQPEQITKLIDEILSISKRASAEFNCKSCGQRQMRWTDIPDAKAVASALGDLLNQGFGRPQEASLQQDPIQFYRLTKIDDLPDSRIESPDVSSTIHKTCSKCGVSKPLTDFKLHKRGEFGRRPRCIECG